LNGSPDTDLLTIKSNWSTGQKMGIGFLDSTTLSAEMCGIKSGPSHRVDLALKVYNGTALIEALRIYYTGFIGIGKSAPKSILDVNGAIATPIVTKTSAYTITEADSTILVDATSAAFTVTLPTAVGIAGRTYTIKKIDSSINNVTLDANGTQTIDGSLSYTLLGQWKAVQVQSDGANWVVIGKIL